MAKLKKRFHDYTFEFDPKIHAQKCGGVQITQPGMALTVKEMLVRSQAGQLIPMDDRLVYPEEEDDTLFEINDLTDIDQMNVEYNEAQTRINDKKNDNSSPSKNDGSMSPKGADEGGTTEANDQTDEEA
jgi:hypothetical protein